MTNTVRTGVGKTVINITDIAFRLLTRNVNVCVTRMNHESENPA
jgi:hypothetical protein